jgi:hypothetical protein
MFRAWLAPQAQDPGCCARGWRLRRKTQDVARLSGPFAGACDQIRVPDAKSRCLRCKPKPLFAGPQSFFGLALLMDVRAGAKPPNYVSLIVVVRGGASQDPPVFSGMVAHAVSRLVFLAGPQASTPLGPSPLAVLQVDNFFPVLGLDLTWGCASKLVEAPVALLKAPAWVRDPDHLWEGVQNSG